MKQERVEEVYEEMGGLVIELDSNPAARGPGYLQDLISKTRGFLNTTMFLLQEVLQERHSKEMELEAAETDFDVQSDELLANDKRVTQLPAIDDRLAMIKVILRKERRSITSVKREIKNLGHVEKAIRFRHKELDSTMSAIRLQRSIIETELRTGSFRGDESDTARGWGRAASQDVQKDAIDEMGDEYFSDPSWDDCLKDVLEVGGDSKDTSSPTPESEGASFDTPSADLEGAELETGPKNKTSNPKVLGQTFAKDSSEKDTGDEDPDIKKFLDEDEDFSALFEDI